MSGYALHPEPFADLEEIWEFIAQDDIESADGVISDIFDAIRSLVNFPRQGTAAPTSHLSLCVSSECAIT